MNTKITISTNDVRAWLEKHGAHDVKPVSVSIHGENCFFTNSSYNCPRLQLYGFSTSRALSRAITRRKRVLQAQSELCKAYSAHLDKQIHAKNI